jgi:hypothetical protein
MTLIALRKAFFVSGAVGALGDLRSGEALRVPGGEGIVFFDAFAKRGFRIVSCREAATFETAPWRRII